MTIKLKHSCIWCDEEVSVDYMICSMKCLVEMRVSAREQGAKSHYTKDDVALQPNKEPNDNPN